MRQVAVAFVQTAMFRQQIDANGANRREQRIVACQRFPRHVQFRIQTVAAITDIGGADGLIHLSELSWGQVTHPSQVLRIGQEVEVYVVGVDRDAKKIALSLKRLQGEPWAQVAEKYQVGQEVTGRITKLPWPRRIDLIHHQKTR